MKPLYTGSEWDVPLLETVWAKIDDMARNQFGLDYYTPQIEIISSEQMLDAYSSVAMPVLYSHWSFGKTFIQNERQYNKGTQGLAYEVVINTDPCIVYLMENNCVDGETEYLSPTGWKNIKEYAGEQVLGYNADGSATFVTPKEYIKSTVTEPMIRIKAKGIDQLVTQKHRVIYQGRNGEIQEILAKDLLKKQVELKKGWDGKIISAYNLKNNSKLDLTDNEIRLMCAVHADGCFSTKGTYCRFGFKNEYKIRRLISLLMSCGISYNISTENKRGSTHISFHPPIRSKRFTEDWYKASSSQLEIIADEVFYWDADLFKHNAYYSQYKEDVDFIQYACNSIQKNASIRKAPTCWALYKSDCHLRNLGEVTETTGDGEAYCFKMPSTMWVARRNNKVFVTGNTATLQTLVLAHAGAGHNHFFKNNYLFKNWTDASSIIDYLKFAKNYIKSCEEKYGEKRVELLLDACHSLQNHGIDKYKKPSRLSKELKKQKEKNWEQYFESTFNDLWRTIPKTKQEKKEQETSKIKLPEENLLYFIEKYSPILKEWEREIVRIVRKISQYFYPQRQTQLLNEGFATFTHHMLMTEMHDQGHIDDGSYIEFLKSHTAVVAQRDWDSKYYSGINVYALGYAMLTDIKRICMNPDEEDKKWFPEICGTDWLTTIKYIVENYRDESFIQQFLSPKVARQFKLFSMHVDEETIFLKVNATHDDDDFLHIRNALAEQYDLSRSIPQIEIVGVDWDNDRWLYLEHKTKNNQRLEYYDMRKTVEHLYSLWGFTVKMEYKDLEGNDLEDVD